MKYYIMYLPSNYFLSNYDKYAAYWGWTSSSEFAYISNSLEEAKEALDQVRRYHERLKGRVSEEIIIISEDELIIREMI